MSLAPSRGTLILVIGPSGAGKDTLINGARQHFTGDSRFHFPRRIITRRWGAIGEDHIPLDARDFTKLRINGGFALSWSAHGLSYGLPASIEDDLADGRHVIANVSRRVVAEAEQRFRPTGIILVTAPLPILTERIATRGREGLSELAERMRTAVTPDWIGERAITIVNDGTIGTGVSSFLAAIERIVLAPAGEHG